MKQEYLLKHKRKSGFKSYLSEAKRLVESELQTSLARLPKLHLQPQVEYATLSGGKRLRPILVILSAESVGGHRIKVIPLALAFEFMHTATLVHDDIIDRDETRRGKLAVHKRWSVNEAILTGDALIALAINLAAEYGERVLKIFARSALELCDGEQADVTATLKAATEESYFRMTTRKSAALFSASTQCGALIGGGTPSEVRALSEFGQHIGIAYQLKDDLLDLEYTGCEGLNDWKDGKITLPIIHAYENSNLSEQRELERGLHALMSGPANEEKAATKSILQITRAKGAYAYCQKRMVDHLQQALDSLSILKDTEYKSHLALMTDSLETWC